MCSCFWEESHAYNKGKTLVVSKVPLPDYRADLDDRHGSTQKEVFLNAARWTIEVEFVVKDCSFVFILFYLVLIY